MGGNTGALVAQHHPERVLSLTLSDCQPRSSAGSRALWEERLAIARSTGLAPIVESALERWFDPERLSQDPALAQRLRAMMAATSLDGYVGGVSALLDYDLHAVINALRLPLIVPGRRARQDGARGPRRPCRHDSAGPVPIVPAAGHISCIDGAPTFTAALTTFLDSLTDTDGANT